MDPTWVAIEIDEMAEKELPQVYLGNPYFDESGKFVCRKVDGLSLIQHISLTEEEMKENIQKAFFTELIWCLAARRNLVWLRREIHVSDEDDTYKLLYELPQDDVAFLAWAGTDQYGSEREVCRRLGSEAELTEKDLVFYKWSPAAGRQGRNLAFNRLVPLEKVIEDDMDFVETFIERATGSQFLKESCNSLNNRNAYVARKPYHRYVVPITTQVKVFLGWALYGNSDRTAD